MNFSFFNKILVLLSNCVCKCLKSTPSHCDIKKCFGLMMSLSWMVFGCLVNRCCCCCCIDNGCCLDNRCRFNGCVIIRSYTFSRTFNIPWIIAVSTIFACWFKIQTSWTGHTNRTCVSTCIVMVTRHRIRNFSKTFEETQIVAL